MGGTLAHQHNSDRFSAVWGNLNMMKGLAKGTLVSDTGISGGWQWKDDGVGGGVYWHDPSRSGALTFNVEAANLLHEQLEAIWNGDDAARNAVADLVITNNDKQKSYTFHNARIQKPPPMNLMTESPTVPWILLYSGVTYSPNTGQKNVIGSGVTPNLPSET